MNKPTLKYPWKIYLGDQLLNACTTKVMADLQKQVYGVKGIVVKHQPNVEIEHYMAEDGMHLCLKGGC